MPTVEGLEFRYALHMLPPGRLPFARWRWELWHGERMLAAGWRGSERDAGRAVCKQASGLAHPPFGPRPPPRPPPGAAARPPPGGARPPGPPPLPRPPLARRAG